LAEAYIPQTREQLEKRQIHERASEKKQKP
jgi:hypothetical protein